MCDQEQGSVGWGSGSLLEELGFRLEAQVERSVIPLALGIPFLLGLAQGR